MTQPVQRRPLVLSVAVLACVLVLGCGGSPTAPSQPPPPQPAQVAGVWSGTFESRQYAVSSILVTLNQTGTTISGTWANSGTTPEAGNITGTVDTSTFTGTITYSFRQGPTCQGSFSGAASSATLNWQSAGFTGNCG